MLKTVVLLHISVDFFLKILWWIEISKEHNLFEIEIFCILKDLTYPKHLNIKQHNLFNIDIHCILKYIKILYVSHYEASNVGSRVIQSCQLSHCKPIKAASQRQFFQHPSTSPSPPLWRGGGGVELEAQAEPRVWASVEDSKPSLFTINYQNRMGRRTRKITILFISLGEQKRLLSKTLKQS